MLVGQSPVSQKKTVSREKPSQKTVSTKKFSQKKKKRRQRSVELKQLLVGKCPWRRGSETEIRKGKNGERRTVGGSEGSEWGRSFEKN
jgi:hypothetical protein